MQQQNVMHKFSFSNDIISACNPGSISLDGRTCVPCSANTYGEICKYKCNCSLKQK